MNTAPTATLDRIRRHLVALKMPRALEGLDALVRLFEAGEFNPLEPLETLLLRSARYGRTGGQMALLTARLTTLKTLESFDFGFQPSLDRNRILSLAQLGFVERREVIHFLAHPARVSRIWLWHSAWRPSRSAKACTSAPSESSSPRSPKPSAKAI